jgi:hypothetical protein
VTKSERNESGLCNGATRQTKVNNEHVFHPKTASRWYDIFAKVEYVRIGVDYVYRATITWNMQRAR